MYFAVFGLFYFNQNLIIDLLDIKEMLKEHVKFRYFDFDYKDLEKDYGEDPDIIAEEKFINFLCKESYGFN